MSGRKQERHHSIKVSSRMVEVGVKVLRESGAVDSPSVADYPLVQRILEKALAAWQGDIKNCPEHSPAPRTPALMNDYWRKVFEEGERFRPRSPSEAKS